MSDDIRASNINAVQSFLDSLNRWDLDAIRAITTEDVVMEVPFAPEGFGRKTEGQERYLELLDQARTVMIDGSENLHDFSFDTLGSNPDEVIAQYKGKMLLRSGKPYSNEYVSRFSLRNGKIARFVEYLDSLKLFVALGGSLIDVDGDAEDSVLPSLLNERANRA